MLLHQPWAIVPFLSLIAPTYALPGPNPLADPIAFPIARPIAEPEPQNTVYAPFSGAIYVTSSNGYTFTDASPAICPNSAQQSCGNINVWNWCCPSGYTCAWISNTLVGCCPTGSTCSNVNNVNVAATTITQTVQVQQATTVVVAQQPTTTTINGVYVAGGAATTNVVYNGYCSTMTADGPNLPTTAAGPCGTILVVSSAVRPWVWGRRALVGVVAATLALIGWLI